MATASYRVFDRSRLEEAAKCPRAYYWNYCFLGLGIRKLRGMPEWALLTGTYVHEGVEWVLRGKSGMEAAQLARDGYYAEVAPLLAELLAEADPVRSELVQREFDQQLDLVVALVYGWSLIGLPRYQQLYEPIGIEVEETLAFSVGAQELRMLTRSDIISRLRTSGQVMLHNLKTVSTPDEKWRQQWPLDQQTLTERIATEDRLGEEVLGVVIEGLAKGSRSEYPKGGGFWQHGSPLVWAWADKPDGQQLPGEGQGFYSRYEWACDAPHLMGNGRKCAGGKNHRLGPGVYKARVAAIYPGGIPAWIDWLLANDRQVLEQQFLTLPAIGRSAYEIERWKRQVLPAELARQQAAERVNELFLQGDRQQAFEQLDYSFPQHTGHGNCIRPWQCGYYDICHAASDPFDDSVWAARVPNHPAEGELVQIAIGEEGNNG